MEDLVKKIEENNKDKIINNLQEENKKLKETIVNMSNCLFTRDNSLTGVIKDIDRNLKRIVRGR